MVANSECSAGVGGWFFSGIRGNEKGIDTSSFIPEESGNLSIEKVGSAHSAKKQSVLVVA
jgi:hypothetical protein